MQQEGALYNNVNPAVSIGADVCSCLNASLVRLNDVIFHSDKITMDGCSRPRNCDNIDTISKKVIALMAYGGTQELGLARLENKQRPLISASWGQR